MSSPSPIPDSNLSPDPQKQAVLLTFYQTCWTEMSWRRNAGYRTIIFGFGYFGLLLTFLAFNPHPGIGLRMALSMVLAVGTVFGAGYLNSNFKKYMAAAELTVRIEEYLGAYAPDYLGTLGALMPDDRRQRPKRPMSQDPVCFLSVLSFLIGGLFTAIAILFIG